MNEINIQDLKEEIKEQLEKYDEVGSFLGFVENQDVSPEVERCFTVGNGYNWVRGNERMRDLIEKVKQEGEK